jgi:hypothetical protein
MHWHDAENEWKRTDYPCDPGIGPARLWGAVIVVAIPMTDEIGIGP